MARARGRGARAELPRGHASRGLRRHRQQRLLACAARAPGGDRRLRRDGQRPRRRRGSALVFPRAARPRGVDRHGLLVVARRLAPRLPGASPARVRSRPRRRGQPRAHARDEHQLLEGAHDGARRALQDLRRGGRRLRAKRGLRGRDRAAPLGRAGLRRPDPRRRPRVGDEPGRAERRPDGAERPGPGGGAARRARGGGRDRQGHRVRRGARHGDAARRSHRGRRPRLGPVRGPQHERAPRGGIGQDQPRAPRGGGGARGAHQDRPGALQERDPAPPPLQGEEPAHRLAGASHGAHGRDAVGLDRRAAARGRQLLRLQRHQQPRGPRGGPFARGPPRDGRSPAAPPGHLRARRGGARRARRRLRAAAP